MVVWGTCIQLFYTIRDWVIPQEEVSSTNQTVSQHCGGIHECTYGVHVKYKADYRVFLKNYMCELPFSTVTKYLIIKNQSV